MPNKPKFNPEALGLTPIMSGAEGASEQNSGQGTAGTQTEWFRVDPTDPNKIENWDMAGNYLGSRVKKSGWTHFRDGPMGTAAKTAAMIIAAPYLAPYLPGATVFGANTLGASALNGAVMGGGTAALSGGDIANGALMGGLGGAAFNALGEYLPQQGFTDAQISQNAGYGAFNNDAVDSMLALENANAGYGAFNNDALDSRLLQEAEARIFENSNRGYGSDNNDLLDNGGPTTPVSRSSDTSDLTSGETNRDLRGYDGEEIGGTGDQTSKAFPDGTPSVDTQKSFLEKASDSIKNKFIGKDGELDWAKVLGAAGILSSTIGGLTDDKPGAKDINELVTKVKPKGFDDPLPTGALSSARPWNTRSRIYSADMPTPIVAGRRYAEGGEIEGALTASAPFVGFVQGEGGGQDDLIEASLSAGEYVFDAESVSMLGDGNNEEGARKLDELRESLRAHKRNAPNNQIAPPAQGALSYMNGGQNG